MKVCDVKGYKRACALSIEITDAEKRVKSVTKILSIFFIGFLISLTNKTGRRKILRPVLS